MIALPIQTDEGPVMGAGSGLTVKDIEVPQPVARIYEIVVVPTPAPTTIPAGLIAAAAVLEVVHVPPPEAVLRLTEFPTQTEDGPEMAEGSGRTVTD